MVTKMIMIKNKNIFSRSYIITFQWYQNQPNWLTIMWSHLHDFYLNWHLTFNVFVFAGSSEYLPSADKWLLHIYCILFAKTSLERYVLRKQTIAQILSTKIVKVRKAAKIRNQYNQVPHLTQYTTWESDKNTIKHHKQEPRGQPFPSS